MNRYQHSRLEMLLSLEWYELALTVLFSFVARTSEVLIAAGLVVSTANFLTDGSIMTAYPGLSIAWAWAQSISLDSSLTVCLSYTFQCLKQHAWIQGICYGVLTMLLSLVAGVITTIDIVSHALHLSMSGAMEHLTINVTLLSQFRAIAVVGFILISRLRTLPVKERVKKTDPAPLPGEMSAEGPDQEAHMQTMIQSLCSQFSVEEAAQIINACLVARKMSLTQSTLKGLPGAQEQQEHNQGKVAPQPRTAPGQQAANGPAKTAPEPPSRAEPPEKEPVAPEPQREVEPPLRSAPEPVSESEAQVLQQTKHEEVPDAALKPGAAPLDGTLSPESIGRAPPEETPMEREARLEQAYQSLLAEGKKPSGRALAERAHIHRSRCVEWLRTRHQKGLAQKELVQEDPSPEQFQGQSLVEPTKNLPSL